ncbi:alpha/beta fold hydrolase [Reichenbachiella ulvae]|uniref:Alpha/beta hydrolase n=1 Tax=Reichenbachiella ulvae TaxID=2980104 RepID=A0ABT3CUD2_9BACT|nr:alpha/beta hydrolase [Reichenbachiella ulvae]MCV9387224.1 alpha/beta hydrolase [Reichenbachiella ulvae]
MIRIIKIYFKTLSVLLPSLAGKQAFSLFQVPMNKKIRDKELPFFEKARAFTIPWQLEDIQAYSMGSEDGPLVFLVHGWESSAASLYAIADRLAAEGHRVIAFNLPAHGYSKLKRANLKICKEAFLQVIDFIKPVEPFSVVSHSFGSAVTTYALARSEWPVNQLVYLSTPDQLDDVFREFADFVGLNPPAFQKVLDIGSSLLGEPVDQVSVSKMGNQVDCRSLTIIHDEKDKIIDKRHAEKVASQWPNSVLTMIKGTGHYRMLWNEKVLDLVSQQLSQTQEKIAD